MGWLKQALTGADNATVAIGRLIGMAVSVVLLILLPIVAMITTLFNAVPVDRWAALLTALQLYVPLIVGGITGLIWGTNPTEPKPKDRDNG
jgi:tetrahydromethanopterin S-methyltransferase subunit F